MSAPDAAALTLRRLRRHLVTALVAAGKATPELDARLLLCHCLGIDETTYIATPELPVEANAVARIETLLQRRLAGEPVSRLIGRRGFWKYEFALSADTLDPRPDSETLIETVLTLLDSRGQRQHPLRLLDLGTGSGALLLSLLMELPRSSGVGTDIAAGALTTAAANAAALGCAERATFRRSNWLDDVAGRFDVVVANPPYIPSGDIDGLAPEVARFDPRRALDGGSDGLAPYQTILPRLTAFLEPAGLAVLEFGDGQHRQLSELASACGFSLLGDNNGLYADLSGRWRCIALAAGPVQK